MLGTGIKRIKECYKNEKVRPKFDASEHCINIILPFINQVEELSEAQQLV